MSSTNRRLLPAGCCGVAIALLASACSSVEERKEEASAPSRGVTALGADASSETQFRARDSGPNARERDAPAPATVPQSSAPAPPLAAFPPETPALGAGMGTASDSSLAALEREVEDGWEGILEVFGRQTSAGDFPPEISPELQIAARRFLALRLAGVGTADSVPMHLLAQIAVAENLAADLRFALAAYFDAEGEEGLRDRVVADICAQSAFTASAVDQQVAPTSLREPETASELDEQPAADASTDIPEVPGLLVVTSDLDPNDTDAASQSTTTFRIDGLSFATSIAGLGRFSPRTASAFAPGEGTLVYGELANFKTRVEGRDGKLRQVASFSASLRLVDQRSRVLETLRFLDAGAGTTVLKDQQEKVNFWARYRLAPQLRAGAYRLQVLATDAESGAEAVAELELNIASPPR